MMHNQIGWARVLHNKIYCLDTLDCSLTIQTEALFANIQNISQLYLKSRDIFVMRLKRNTDYNTAYAIFNMPKTGKTTLKKAMMQHIYISTFSAQIMDLLFG